MDNKTFEAIVFFGMCAVLIAFGIYVIIQDRNDKKVRRDDMNPQRRKKRKSVR